MFTTFLVLSVRLLTKEWGQSISRAVVAFVLLLCGLIFLTHLEDASGDTLLLAALCAFLLPLFALYHTALWRILVFDDESRALERKSFWVWFDDHKELGLFKISFLVFVLLLARLLADLFGFGNGFGAIVLMIGLPIAFVFTAFRLAILEEREIVEKMNLRVRDMFPELLEEDLPEATEDGLSVIQFHASWCKPCKPMALTLYSLLEERQDVKLFSVDAESNERLLDRFGVKLLPCIVIVWNGEILAYITGRKSKTVLRRTINKVTARLPIPAI